ncbi:hypothetical protein KY289_017024 [Solanum tuberosum]|nr:hypothetical protein KY284_016816 [Solanum tuberosum]KAH0689666.1 hypothetical protein KY289_017024 [Solanum tuberosum]
MNRDPSPSLDVYFRELLREEQRLVTQNAFKKENDVTVAFAAQGKRKGSDMSRTQCYSCKEYGHIASNCSKKFCNYCKQQGHIIKECPTRPQNRRINAFQAGINGSTNDNSSSGQVLTPEMVQQMIVSAFSALRLQGNDVTSNFWIVDSGASNHMTNSTSILKNVRKYQGPSQIQLANGSNLPITKVGDITPTFKNVFVSPKLSTSLTSVGQLVDNNCHVNFSRNGCLMQDQVLGMIIAKGPKVGRLFPVRFSIPPVLSFACTSTASKTEIHLMLLLFFLLLRILSSSFKRFKPGFVYERRRPTLSYPDIDPPPETVPQLESENFSRSGPLEPTRRSTRVSRTPNWYGFSSTLSNISVPSCYSQASKHECWQKAMEEELLALKENDTWDIVSCPSNVFPIGCKWVYSIKLHSDGSLNRYKAGLVVLGNK